MASNINFIQSEEAEPHIERRKEIMRKYPQVKSLIGKNPSTFLYILLTLGIQVGMVAFVHDKPWWVIVLGIYLVGAFANHACYVLIHDSVHGMVFKGMKLNRWSAVLANLPTAIPSAIPFQTYHLKHHAHQGVHELDADLPRKWEVTLFNWGAVGKIMWMVVYSLILALRSFSLEHIRVPGGWGVINYIVVLSFDALIVYFFGVAGLAYLVGSTLVGLGLHPVGARWIQEHFVIAPDQETYSYYGPLNKVSFNVGYHNEHHDFPGIPWNRLPEVRKLAPEFYDTLVYHDSWVKLLLRFLFDPNVTLESRVERETRFGLTKVAA